MSSFISQVFSQNVSSDYLNQTNDFPEDQKIKSDFKKKISALGWLSGGVSAFSSGRDPRVLESSPMLGFLLSGESASLAPIPLPLLLLL